MALRQLPMTSLRSAYTALISACLLYIHDLLVKIAHHLALLSLLDGVLTGRVLEKNLKNEPLGFLDHALVFALGLILIIFWTYTSNLAASGIIAGAFGWYLVAKLENHLFAVTLATVIGFIVYTMSFL